ncbi:MAG TPA: response regulator [Thermoanaerobaculia bacterium]|nr:response regulator [Thermoanaerobaculia bacterium]
MRLEKRILIVDDDDAIRALLTTILRRRGFAPDVASNGAEAIEKLEAVHYSLAILDLMMPRMSGYDVLDRLTAMIPAHRPLVLVLTAGLVLKRLDLSFVIATIQKPFDVDLILDTVIGCLDAAPPEESPEIQLPAPGKPN